TFLQEEFLKAAPTRLKGIALIPLQDIGEAVKELRRAVTALRMVGAILPAVGLRRPLGDPYYDPVYEEAQRLGAMLAVHGAPAKRPDLLPLRVGRADAAGRGGRPQRRAVLLRLGLPPRADPRVPRVGDRVPDANGPQRRRQGTDHVRQREASLPALRPGRRSWDENS